MKKSIKSKVVCYILVFAMLPVFSTPVIAAEDYGSLIMDEGVITVEDYDSLIMDEDIATDDYDNINMDEAEHDEAIPYNGYNEIIEIYDTEEQILELNIAPQSASGGFIAPVGPIPGHILPENIVTISSQQELAAIGGVHSAGRYFILSNDIHLVGEWTPINNFYGILDGRGHSIHNLFVQDSSNSDVGLFGYLRGRRWVGDRFECVGSGVKNLAVHIGPQGLTSFAYRAAGRTGGIAGRVGEAGFGDITPTVFISNTVVIGDISASMNVSPGGINDGVAGGLVGSVRNIQLTISDSYAMGNINATRYAGGLVGLTQLGELTISNSYATGNIIATGDAGGGLVGSASSANIINSFAEGDVTSNSSAGGLVGIAISTNIVSSFATGHILGSNDGGGSSGGLVGSAFDSSISESYATGNVSAASTGSWTGGLVGSTDASVRITNSYAIGAVSSVGSLTGGLVGRNAGVITDSHSTGTVNVDVSLSGSFIERIAGGLVGHNEGTVADSYATGDVTVIVTGLSNSSSSTAIAGGLVGANEENITNSHASGNVHAKAIITEEQISNIALAIAGGLVGRSRDSMIIGSNASGEVSAEGGTVDVGGLIGRSDERGQCTVEDSVADGSVTAQGTGTSTLSAGGIIGRGGQVTIRGAIANGNVTAQGDFVAAGGLVGRGNRSVIENSRATGDVVAVSGNARHRVAMNAGGLLGRDEGDFIIQDSSASGNVTAQGMPTNYAGGLVGGFLGEEVDHADRVVNSFRYDSQVIRRYDNERNFVGGATNNLGEIRGVGGRDEASITLDNAYGFIGTEFTIRGIFRSETILPHDNISWSVYPSDAVEFGQMFAVPQIDFDDPYQIDHYQLSKLITPQMAGRFTITANVTDGDRVVASAQGTLFVIDSDNPPLYLDINVPDSLMVSDVTSTNTVAISMRNESGFRFFGLEGLHIQDREFMTIHNLQVRVTLPEKANFVANAENNTVVTVRRGTLSSFTDSQTYEVFIEINEEGNSEIIFYINQIPDSRAIELSFRVEVSPHIDDGFLGSIAYIVTADGLPETRDVTPVRVRPPAPPTMNRDHPDFPFTWNSGWFGGHYTYDGKDLGRETYFLRGDLRLTQDLIIPNGATVSIAGDIEISGSRNNPTTLWLQTGSRLVTTNRGSMGITSHGILQMADDSSLIIAGDFNFDSDHHHREYLVGGEARIGGNIWIESSGDNFFASGSNTFILANTPAGASLPYRLIEITSRETRFNNLHIQPSFDTVDIPIGPVVAGNLYTGIPNRIRSVQIPGLIVNVEGRPTSENRAIVERRVMNAFALVEKTRLNEDLATVFPPNSVMRDVFLNFPNMHFTPSATKVLTEFVGGRAHEYTVTFFAVGAGDSHWGIGTYTGPNGRFEFSLDTDLSNLSAIGENITRQGQALRRSLARKEFENLFEKVGREGVRVLFDSAMGNVFNPISAARDMVPVPRAYIRQYMTNMEYLGAITRLDLSRDSSRNARFHCPIDIEVFYGDRLVGSIINDEVRYFCDYANILLWVIGEAKEVTAFGESDYTIRVIARDDGSMSVNITEYDGERQEHSRNLFFDIPLQIGAHFTLLFPAGINNSYQIRRDDTGTVYYPDEIFMGGSVPQVLISALASGSGEVYGTGYHSLGDTATLFARPGEGYVFYGWIENSEKIDNAEPLFIFHAVNDRSMEARFISDSAGSTDREDPTEPTDPSRPPFRPNFGTSPAQAPTTQTPSTALSEDEVSVAEALFRLGLFVGTGTDADGNPNFELNRPPTRLEALALVIRLMGLQNEAMTFTGTNNFTDVPAWGEHYAAFGYHLGITVGVNDERTLFAPNRQVTAHEFTTFLLRVLGYNEADGDFIFEEAMLKASNIGFFSPFSMARVSTDNFLRDHAVHAMANGLLTAPKGSSEYLLHRLAGQGVFSREDADWFRENIR